MQCTKALLFYPEIVLCSGMLHIGPFKVLSRKGEVAYELELPEILSAVHNVFHVSQLKKCHPEMSDTLLNDIVPLEEV
jgi:hypothetical protein